MGALSKHQDPIAVVLSSVVGMLGALGLVARAGLTGDQVAELMGFALAIVAAIRTVFERRRHREVTELRTWRDRLATVGPPLDDTPDPDDPVRSPPGNVEGETTEPIDVGQG